jgi:hypothetical protein
LGIMMRFGLSYSELERLVKTNPLKLLDMD